MKWLNEENLWQHIDFNKYANGAITDGTIVYIIDDTHPMFKRGDTNGEVLKYNKDGTYAVQLLPFWANDQIVNLKINQFVTQRDYERFDPEWGSHLDDSE